MNQGDKLDSFLTWHVLFDKNSLLTISLKSQSDLSSQNSATMDISRATETLHKHDFEFNFVMLLTITSNICLQFHVLFMFYTVSHL